MQLVTNAELAAILDEDTYTILQRHIRRLNKYIRSVKQHVSEVEQSTDLDAFSKWFIIHAVWKGPDIKDAYKQLRRLKDIQASYKYKEQQIRDTLDTRLDVDAAKRVPINECYVFENVRRRHASVTAICPFHQEKTPSFVVYQTNTFHCFGCQAHGDVIDFIMKMHGYEFGEAVRYLTGR